jgi:acyl carrier protein
VLRLPVTSVEDELAMTDVDAWDSLTHMELIAAVESTFEVQLTFDEIVAMTTVAAVKRVLAEKGAL